MTEAVLDKNYLKTLKKITVHYIKMAVISKYD